MRIKVRDAVAMMQATIQSLGNLADDREIEFALGYSTGLAYLDADLDLTEGDDDFDLNINPFKWVEETPVPYGIAYESPGQVVCFLYEKENATQTRDDFLSHMEDEIRVGEVNLAVGIGELHRLGHQMDGVGRIRAERADRRSHDQALPSWMAAL